MLKSKIYILKRILEVSLPPKRIWNAIKASISYQFSKKGKVLKWNHQPLFISLEPTNVCNLHCPECPVGTRSEKVKTIRIDSEKSKEIIYQLSSTLTHIIFYFQGEPFMNPKFLSLVKYARTKNIFTSTSTNAQLISKERAKEIVESGLDKIIISIDGTTQEIYEKYRVGGKLEKALQVVSDINFWKKELKKAHPFIEIQFIVMKHNEHQISEIKSLTKEAGGDVCALKTAQIYDYENGSELIPSIDKYARYKRNENGKFEIKSPLKNSCNRLWSGSVINSNGDILPCCFDKTADHTFGNINNEDFQSIWKNANAHQFRKSIISDRKQFEICRNCTER